MQLTNLLQDCVINMSTNLKFFLLQVESIKRDDWQELFILKIFFVSTNSEQ